MLKIIISLACLLFSTCSIIDKNKKDISWQDKTSIDTLRIINEIKKQYTEIDSKLYLYNKVKKVLLDETAEGAELTGYFENKELKKISGIYYGETFKTTMEYYYNGDEFFYVYAKIYFYEKPIYIDNSPKIKKTEEELYYFFKGNLIRFLSNSIEISHTSQEFLEQTNNLKKDFEKYKKIFILK